MKTQSFTRTFFKRIRFLFPLFMILMLSSCGQKSIIKDVLVQTYESDGEVYARLDVGFALGNVMLPSISIPIYNPNDMTTCYGQVSVLGGLNGVNDVVIDVNLTQALHINGGIASLPDGSPLPLGGLGNAAVIQIPLFNDQHRLYIAADSGVALMGFALTFKELDVIGKTLGGADLLIPFNIKKVRGAAGFFTDRQPGGTGIAAFVDIGGVITPSELEEVKSMGDIATKSLRVRSAAEISDQSTITFSSKLMSSKKKRKFDTFLYKLHKKKQRLHLN